MPLFNYSKAQDIGNAVSQIGPDIGRGTAQGIQLGQQRARDQFNAQNQGQMRQQALLDLQQRIAQAKAENEMKMQQFLQQQQTEKDTAGYHSNMVDIARQKLGQAGSKPQGNKWIVAPQGFLLNQSTGEVKPLPAGMGQGGPQGETKLNPTSVLSSYFPAIQAGIQNPQLINNNPTNTAYNPGLASMYSQGTNLQQQLAQRALQGGMSGMPGGGGGPQLGGIPGQGPQTNMPPQAPMFRYDPSSGQIVPMQ